MKKFLLFAGLAAAALSLVGCNKEADVRVLGKRTAELRLSTVDTRTVNDGMNTKWAADDALTVFYAPAGTTTWSANTQFTINDADAGVAKGEVELTANAYDWYLFYPYTSQIPNPTGKNDSGEWTGYFYVGSSSSGSQTQAGLNSMDHISGKRVPLVGRVTGVPTDQTPEVPMKNLSTLLKINVTNVYESPVTITKVSFTAPTDIVGSAYLDFSGATPQLHPSEGHIGKTAQLTVENAEPLASGATASFYLAVMPFSVASGDLLTVDIVAAEGSFKAEVNATKAYNFEAGKMKTLNVDFEVETPTQTKTVTEAIALADNSDVTITGAIVAACSTKGFIITDGTSNVYVYQNAAPEVVVGDEVTVSGQKITYYGLPEISGPSIQKTASGKTVPRTTLVALTADNIDGYTSSAADYISVTGVLEKSGSYYNIRPDGSTRYASADYLVSSLAPSEDWVGKIVKMTGYFNTIHSKNNYVKVIVTAFEFVSDGSQSGANTLTTTMTEYVDANNCTVSSGSDVTVYTTLQLNESVRLSTTGTPGCGSFWVTSSSNPAKQWRLYQNKGGNATITVANGCELVSVKLTYATTNNGVLLDAAGNQVTSGTTKEVSGSSVTFTVGNTGDGENGQVRITDVEVKYTGNGTTFPDNPQPPTEITTTITMAGNKSVYIGETVELGATSNVDGAPFTYESEDPSIATVNASGVVTGVAAGTVKVYARIAAVSGQYTAAERYCNVTVSAKPQETEGTVVFDQAYLAANKDGSKDVISYTNSSDYGSNVPTELRVYKSQTLVVSASGGKKITSIQMTCTANGTAKQGPGAWGTGAPTGYTFEEAGPHGTWTGSASSVTFTATDNQVRIIELVVKYE